jgi:hypothetical protein
MIMQPGNNLTSGRRDVLSSRLACTRQLAERRRWISASLGPRRGACPARWSSSAVLPTPPRRRPPANSSHLNTTGYQVRREFSLTEGSARGTRGRLGPRGRDQRGLVAGTRYSDLGGGRGSRTGQTSAGSRRGRRVRPRWGGELCAGHKVSTHAGRSCPFVVLTFLLGRGRRTCSAVRRRTGRSRSGGACRRSRGFRAGRRLRRRVIARCAAQR